MMPIFLEPLSNPELVEQEFQTISGDIVTVLIAVAGIALGILVVMLGFKYGKRLFQSLSK